MTQSLATGVAGALSEAQRQIQATQQQVEGLGGAVYRATQEAALATYTAERASRMATPPAVTPATPARTGLPAGEPLHEAGAAHAIHELLVWLKDPKSRSAGRIPEVPEAPPTSMGATQPESVLTLQASSAPWKRIGCWEALRWTSRMGC